MQVSLFRQRSVDLVARLFRHGGAVLGICGIVLLWGSVLHSLSIERRQAMRGATGELINLSRAFEEHIAGAISAVDQALLYVRDRNATDTGGVDPVFMNKSVVSIMRVDASGQVRGANLDVGDRDYFLEARSSSGDALLVGKPVPEQGRWTIPMARKIIGPDGAFAGLVVASFDPLYLSRFWQSVELGASGGAALIGADGVVRARVSVGNMIPGQSVAASLLMANFGRSKVGTFEEASPVTGIASIYAYRPVEPYKLLIVVGTGVRDVLVDYEHNRLAYLWLASLLSSVLLVVTVIIERHAGGLQRTREALRVSEAGAAHKSALLEAALENMSQGIVMVDASRRLVVCNSRAKEKLDLPDALMAGNPTTDDVLRWQWQQGEFGENGGGIDEWLRGFLLSGGMSDAPQVYERTRPNGCVLEIRSVPLEGGGLVRTYTDITARRDNEDRLRAARDEADRAAAAKSEFLAMMSHEIRSPLHGLLGVIELLRESECGPEQGRMLEMAHDCAGTLLRVVNDVLDFSKLEAGEVAIVSEPTSLADLLASITQPIALAASRKGLRFRCDLAEDVPAWIAIDPWRLRQILGNLLGNAVKFTGSGEIGLTVSCDGAGGQKRLRIAVSDTGIGMATESIARLFEPFAQADASTTKNFGGTGLGLSISRRLARLLGGDIEAASLPGCGSVFTLSVPLVAEQPGLVGVEGGFEDGALAGIRVLVAEDQETNRWVMRRQLARLGVVADIVETGQAALVAGVAEKYDLIITDCHMPQMDGVELARRIRAAEAEAGEARVPIVGLTADITAITRERCLAVGMDDVLCKPLNLKMLEAALRRIVGRAPVVEAARAGPVDDGVFDPSMYCELFDDAEEEGREWLDAFFTTADGLMAQIGDCTASDDRDALAAAAHRLAGTSLTVGAARLGGMARALEGAAAAAGQPELTARGHEMRAALAATRAEIGGRRWHNGG